MNLFVFGVCVLIASASEWPSLHTRLRAVTYQKWDYIHCLYKYENGVPPVMSGQATTVSPLFKTTCCIASIPTAFPYTIEPIECRVHAWNKQTKFDADRSHRYYNIIMEAASPAPIVKPSEYCVGLHANCFKQHIIVVTILELRI